MASLLAILDDCLGDTACKLIVAHRHTIGIDQRPARIGEPGQATHGKQLSASAVDETTSPGRQDSSPSALRQIFSVRC